MTGYSLVKKVKNAPWVVVTNLFFLYLNKGKANGCRLQMSIFKYEIFTVWWRVLNSNLKV